jgi:hypothetical protein
VEKCEWAAKIIDGCTKKNIAERWDINTLLKEVEALSKIY